MPSSETKSSRPATLGKCVLCPATLKGTKADWNHHLTECHKDEAILIDDVYWIRPPREAVLGKHYQP